LNWTASAKMTRIEEVFTTRLKVSVKSTPLS
jgi:hypothetical protein